MRTDDNQGSLLHYYPNSFGEWQDSKEYTDPPLELDGAAYRWDYHEDDDDYYTQPGKLFRLMTKEQQQALFENTARNMSGVPEFIKIRHIKNCTKADIEYGKGIADAMEYRF